MGLTSWGDLLKQPFFLPTALLTYLTNKPRVRLPPKQPSSSPSGHSISRSEICDAWSWYNDCKTHECPLHHVCIVCKLDHQAKTCPKRKYPFPPCSQDPRPQDWLPPHQLTHWLFLHLSQPVSQPTPVIDHLSFQQVFLARLALPPLRFPKALSTPQRLFSPSGPILPAIWFHFIPNSSTLQDQTPLPFVCQYPLLSRCTNRELGYRTTMTPTSVTS